MFCLPIDAKEDPVSVSEYRQADWRNIHNGWKIPSESFGVTG